MIIQSLDRMGDTPLMNTPAGYTQNKAEGK
jgi:hypothetical protein